MLICKRLVRLQESQASRAEKHELAKRCNTNPPDRNGTISGWNDSRNSSKELSYGSILLLCRRASDNGYMDGEMKMKDDDKVKGFDALAGLAMMPFAIAYRGWALSVVWNWFIAGVFAFAPVLSVPQAVGLSAALIFFQKVPESKEGKSFVGLVIRGFVLTSLVLLMAWIANLFQ